MTKISIVIPVYNSAGTLALLLESIKYADFPDKEVIVVDDGSTDESANVAEKYGARVVRLDENRGPAYARNAGIEASTKDIIVFLDADVTIPPHLISHVAGRMEAEPQILALNGYYDSKPLNQGLYNRHKAIYINHLFQGKKETEVLETCCCAIRRQVLVELGKFNTSYTGADVEDYELGYRIARKGPMEIDHNMVIGHNFHGFIHNARNYFRRSAMWTELFLARRKFDSAGATQQEGITRILGAASALLATLVIMGAESLGWLFFATFILFMVYGRSFFLELLKKQGVVEAALGVLFYVADSIVIIAGAAWGVFRYFSAGART